MAYNLGILISGNGSNMLNIINASKEHVIKSRVVTVVSNNSNAVGLKKAENNGIDTKIIEQTNFNNIQDYETTLSQYLIDRNVNLVCLAGYMKVLSKHFIKDWSNRIINIHPSLLPAFRGLNTHQRAIEKGVKYSGCTVHFVDKNIDSGKIIDQEIVRIQTFDNPHTLKKKILMKEHKLYIKALKYLEKKNEQI